jgi:hypothetical protein
MKLKIITFCLLFVTIFVSCKKEDLSKGLNTGNSNVPILSKVLVDNQSSYEYVYNDSNMISEVKSKFDFTINHYNNKGQLVTAEYYGNDNILSSNAEVSANALSSTTLVTSENGTKSGVITYEYNDNGQLTKTTYSLPSTTSSEYSGFTYDSNNRISRQTMYWANIETGYIDYSYDVKGNLIKEMLYNTPSTGVEELITTTSYNFDNENNPYKSSSKLLVPGINTNPNNIIKETYTIHFTPDQGSDDVQVIETSYQYNGLGYPVSKNGNVSYVYE